MVLRGWKRLDVYIECGKRKDGRMKERGLIIVHTGNGKGKTTAALGMALRAWGQGMKILILQFIKGGWKYGELKAIERLRPNLAIVQMGEGFAQNAEGNERAKHAAAAEAALSRAREEISRGGWDMVILDEINYAVKFGLVSVGEALELTEIKPEAMHLVLTGRDARAELIDRADLVTEMREIKHPHKAGVKAQKGVEF